MICTRACAGPLAYCNAQAGGGGGYVMARSSSGGDVKVVEGFGIGMIRTKIK